MPTWPTELQPYPLVSGYQEAPPNTAIRTEMDTGPAKQRRRYTAAPRTITGAVVLKTKAEVDVLDAFFVTTLQGGALSFDWQDRNGVTRTFRFVAGSDALTYEPIEPDRWRASMRLEIMP